MNIKINKINVKRSFYENVLFTFALFALIHSAYSKKYSENWETWKEVEHSHHEDEKENDTQEETPSVKALT